MISLFRLVKERIFAIVSVFFELLVKYYYQILAESGHWRLKTLN